MPTFPLKYAAGVVSDDTVLARGGRFTDADKVRWVRSGIDQPLFPEATGGWERLTLTALSGICRNTHAWIDNAGLLNLAFGTHSKLYVWRGGAVYDITPFGPPTRLASAPFTVSAGSATMSVHEVAHGYANGISVKLANTTSVGRRSVDGTYTIAVVDADHYTVTLGGTATLAVTLAANPLSVINLSPVVTVTETAHNIADGTSVVFSGASAIGGITPNGTFPITVIDANSYSYTFTSPATSTVAAGGGAAVVSTIPTTGGGTKAVAVPQTELPAGQVNGTGTAGYSTGAYGVGGYGQPSTADYFPRTWSFGNLGQALIASPRDGAIYEWDNDTSARASVITEAPHRCTSIVVTPERAIMALGCNEEVSNTFNPRCVRNCDLTDETIWTTDFATTAKEKVLEGAGRIVSGRVVGGSELIWTSNEVWQSDYIGATDELYRFTRQGDDCGLIGPNAVAVKGQSAYWLAPDLMFYATTLGGEPTSVPCPMREEIRANLTPSQKDKIIATTISAFGEVWMFYPDVRDGLEVSRAVFTSIADGWWSKAQIVRTAFMDAGPADFPVGIDASGNCYWHERGTTADGGQITGFLEAGPQYINAGQNSIFLRGFQPDFTSQVGTLNLTVLTREKPQSPAVVSGPFMSAPGQLKVDLHTEGRLISWRLDFASGPLSWRMGVPVAEGKITSRRPK